MEAFHIFTQRMLENLEALLKEKNSAFFSSIKIELSMSLYPYDPAAKENDDNLIFNIFFPWQKICPFIFDGSLSVDEHPENILYDYIIKNAIPYVDPEDFARVGSIDADIILVENRAWKMTRDTKKAENLSPLETIRLFELKSEPTSPKPNLENIYRHDNITKKNNTRH